ncbi:hypothetical protein D1872_235080 [compost metagenome]
MHRIVAEQGQQNQVNDKHNDQSHVGGPYEFDQLEDFLGIRRRDRIRDQRQDAVRG